jgi:hypothetical protein
MISESQIREKLGRYLRDDVSLDGFEDWFAQSSWNMHKDSGEEAQKLASAIELRLAEHSSGHLSERALRDELRKFANPPVVSVAFGNVQLVPEVEPASNVILAVPRAQVFSFIGRLEVSHREIPSLEEVGFVGRQQLVESL